jgi:dienelactone hydrolase
MMRATRWAHIVVAASLFAGAANQSQAAEPYIQEELRISYALAGPRGLEALLVRPNEPGRHPLALIAHGSPRSPNDRPDMSPWAMLPQATEFARRGWAAVVVMRRGYGGSGGDWAEGYGACANPNYIAAGNAAAADLKAAFAFLATRPDIDSTRAISVGVSAGGFATVALAADPPPGLVAAINFAGGRGSLHDDDVCREDRLIEAFRFFGARTRIPMLWVYAQNDHFFGPKLAQRLRDASVEGGAGVEFVGAPAFGPDGHGLFSLAGIPVWSAFVDAFLQHHGLQSRTSLLPPRPRPPLAAPAALSTNGRNAFETYLMSPPHKAFALAPDGHFGWRSGQRTTEAARSGALTFCRQGAQDCEVMFVDDAGMARK